MPRPPALLLATLALALGALRCSPSQKTSPPPASSSTTPGAATPAADKAARRNAAMAGLAQSAEPCSPGYAMQCSDNETHFNCSCQNPQGAPDPARTHWTQVAEPDRVLGRMWMYRLGDSSSPPVPPERQARWAGVQADLQQRLGSGAHPSNLRITRRNDQEDWELVVGLGAQTCVVNYDGAGVFLKKRCDTFHPD